MAICETCDYANRSPYKSPCAECDKTMGSPFCCYENEEKPTNADRIRAMSDEELADVVVCPHIGNWDLCRDDCKKCRLDWLKQPAEVDGNA